MFLGPDTLLVLVKLEVDILCVLRRDMVDTHFVYFVSENVDRPLLFRDVDCRNHVECPDASQTRLLPLTRQFHLLNCLLFYLPYQQDDYS